MTRIPGLLTAFLVLPALPTPAFPQDKPGDREKVKVSFSGLELEALAQQVERVTKKTFAYPEQLLKGKKVTLQSEKPITPDEFYRVFQSVCLMHGLSLVPVKGENIDLVKIVPAVGASKEPGAQPVLSRGDALPPGDGLVFYVLAPKFISAQKAVSAVTPAVSQTGQVQAIPNSDLLLLVDGASSVGRAEKLLALVDVPGPAVLVASVGLQYLPASQAKTQVVEFAQAVEKVSTGEAGRSRLEVMVDERLNLVHLVGQTD
ncbi:MAG TPA: hypothetical protein VEN81_12180, partial [Planctomycetota bacterium]|nr:hypothetical protein [Planctomycetota bacterium]